MLLNCPHYESEEHRGADTAPFARCAVAGELGGVPAGTEPAACKHCEGCTPAQAVNEVTVFLAARAAGKAGRPEVVAALVAEYPQYFRNGVSVRSAEARLAAVLAGTGVGSQLWRMLEEIGVEHSPTCECLAWAEQMNAWGPDGCRQNRGRVVDHLRKSRAVLGWRKSILAVVHAAPRTLAWRLNPLDPYGSLLDEAIRREEAASINPITPITRNGNDGKHGNDEPIDILLPLGPGSRFGNVELRYALRSIEAHAIGYRRVVVVGAVPKWLHQTDRCLPVRRREIRGTNKAYRIAGKVRWAFENLDMTPTVAFWNDDYVLLRDVDVRTIPNYYRGQLWRSGRGGWNRLLQHTAETLQAAGYGTRHFDIHVPILYERDKFLAIANWWDRARQDRRGLVAKSVYGNIHCAATAVSTRDAKLLGNWEARLPHVAHRWVVSYGDLALRAGFATWLGQRYPEPTCAEMKPARRKKCKKC